MLPHHTQTFFEVAQKLSCWIGVREPNPLSDKWINQGGCRPKGCDCKAKTADNPSFRFAGLVVDPMLCPEAFRRENHSAALSAWRGFLIGNRIPHGFSREELGPEKGLVKQHGLAIFADYDLMLLNRSNEKGEFLTTSYDEQATLFAKAKPDLNFRFGVPMIQHGAEFMWTGGVGARAMEFVLWFGPGRRFNRSVSSMPKGGH